MHESSTTKCYDDILSSESWLQDESRRPGWAYA